MGLRSRLFGTRFGIHDLVSTMVSPPPVRPSGPRCSRHGLQALVVPPQQSANEPTGGIRAGSLSLGWWFVVCGTLKRHPRKWLFVLQALRTERCPRFPAVFACITPRAACATRIQPYRAWCVRVQRVPARRWVNRK